MYMIIKVKRVNEMKNFSQRPEFSRNLEGTKTKRNNY